MSEIVLPCPAEKLIRHRPPMLLIDNLLEKEGDRAVASTHIDNDNICFSAERGILPEYFIEIIAQTMAAANAYEAVVSHSPPKNGLIVGIDNFNVQQRPAGADNFLINVVKTMDFGTMKVMEGAISAGSATIATVELKVWEFVEGEEKISR